MTRKKSKLQLGKKDPRTIHSKKRTREAILHGASPHPKKWKPAALSPWSSPYKMGTGSVEGHPKRRKPTLTPSSSPYKINTPSPHSKRRKSLCFSPKQQTKRAPPPKFTLSEEEEDEWSDVDVDVRRRTSKEGGASTEYPQAERE